VGEDEGEDEGEWEGECDIEGEGEGEGEDEWEGEGDVEGEGDGEDEGNVEGEGEGANITNGMPNSQIACITMKHLILSYSCAWSFKLMYSAESIHNN